MLIWIATFLSDSPQYFILDCLWHTTEPRSAIFLLTIVIVVHAIASLIIARDPSAWTAPP
jgi:hypothetical protein